MIAFGNGLNRIRNGSCRCEIANFLLASVFLITSVWGQEALLPNQEKLTRSELSQIRTKAEAGDADAELKLALAYEDGNGVPQNDALAATLYRKAAEQNNAAAQNNLGLLYWKGQGVEKNKQEAVQWYKKAARQKNPKAMFNLGAAYYNGEGIGFDELTSFAWFLLAQQAGSVPGGDAINRLNTEHHLFSLSDVQVKVGDMYRTGEDLPQNNSEAAKWYRLAADSHNLAAETKLAGMLVDGAGIPADYPTALSLCEDAAKKRYSPGFYCIGYMYLHGLGVKPDSGEAIKQYKRAADLGHQKAALAVAQMYWKGDGVSVSKPDAYLWFYSAARISAPGAKQQAGLLWSEMTPDETSKANKKLKQLRLDVNKVHEFMDRPDPPASSRLSEKNSQ